MLSVALLFFAKLSGLVAFVANVAAFSMLRCIEATATNLIDFDYVGRSGGCSCPRRSFGLHGAQHL